MFIYNSTNANHKLDNSINKNFKHRTVIIRNLMSNLIFVYLFIILNFDFLPKIQSKHIDTPSSHFNLDSNHNNNNNRHSNHQFKSASFSSKKYRSRNLKQQRLLLISFGGFRHDYIKAYKLTNFERFLSDGVKSSHLNPQFATQTYPNHWSMATGLYVENHGIIANKFYDPLFKEYFTQHKHDLKWWNASEPIWVEAVRHGIKTGCYFWPGGETNFINSSLYTKVNYHDNVPFHLKLNQTLKWFLNDEFKFVLLYHNQPDAIAHKYGINSPEFNVTLNQLDESFGELIAQLKSKGLYYADDFNVVVVSDHGMVNIKRNIVINDFFDDSDASIWSFSRNLIHLKPLIDLDDLLMKLSKIPDITVTLKYEMPERLHYKENRRIADVIISALEGVGFVYITKEPVQLNHNGRMQSIPLTNEQKRRLLMAAADKAASGYDKLYPNMRGVFLARGSMFKRNFSSEHPIENIDIYPLVCSILGVECEQRDGSFERVKRFLKHEHRMAHIDFERHVEENSSEFCFKNNPPTRLVFYLINLFIFNYFFLIF